MQERMNKSKKTTQRVLSTAARSAGASAPYSKPITVSTAAMARVNMASTARKWPTRPVNAARAVVGNKALACAEKLAGGLQRS